MRKKITLFSALVPMLLTTGTAFALPGYVTSFNTQYLAAYQAAHPGQTAIGIANCALCHPGGAPPALNSYGSAFLASGHNYTTIAAADSDGDTYSNLTEIMALPSTYPGNNASHPTPPADTTKPLVTAFTIPATSSSLVVSITTLTATDAVGVTGYMVTESATAPLPGAAGWGVPPADFTFLTEGAKTLYAWAKDAAGNVSLSMSAPVTITLTAGDTVKPTVTAFAIPATSNSLVVPITAFTATDNVKVTRFKVTTTATAPLATAAGWTATKPVNYTFPTAGAKTLYGWAKDAAGNVSLSMSAPVTITVTDNAKPVVTAFTIPATSSSLVIPISIFTATDNVAVTGYKVTETATAPLAGATGWTAAKPMNYTFLAAAGAKTLYAWARDAAGRVSLSLSAPVTVTRTDTVKPVVNTFTVVPAATANTATITALTATDNVSVTGYKLTPTATAPLAGAAGWTAAAPASYTFPSAGAKKLYAWSKDAGGNVSLSKVANVTVAAAAAAAIAPQATAPIVAPAALTPVPANGQMLKYVYAPTELPAASIDPALAMPIGVGPVATGGSTVTLDASLGLFDGPVDVYLTLYMPAGVTAGMTAGQTFMAYTYNAALNSFEPVNGQMKAWQSGVMELNARVWDNLPVTDFAPGTYMLTLEVTPAGQSGSSYAWSTSFTIR